MLQLQPGAAARGAGAPCSRRAAPTPIRAAALHTHARCTTDTVLFSAAARRNVKLVCRAAAATERPAAKPEAEVPGMTAFLDSLKYDRDGLLAVIVQVRVAAGEATALHAAPADHLVATPLICCAARGHWRGADASVRQPCSCVRDDANRVWDVACACPRCISSMYAISHIVTQLLVGDTRVPRVAAN